MVTTARNRAGFSTGKRAAISGIEEWSFLSAGNDVVLEPGIGRRRWKHPSARTVSAR